jgi:transcriptional regulator with PAS, ATPase and Fis domain
VSPARSVDGGGRDPELSRATERAGGPEHRLRVRRFRLVVVSGPDAGLSWLSEGKQTVLGTHPTADFALHDRTVSRFHCEIAVQEEGALLRDLGSRNGTLVDGVPVLVAPLRGGSTLTLGQSQLRFELADEAIDIPLSEQESFGPLLARSLSMRAAVALMERAAASDVAVLLEGETGTGKEVASEAIHRASARREEPFIVVDCGAIPPTLIESELFGHERGAFTGAVEAREGAFQAADRGTILLDEVGELDPAVQPKLLRILEKREIKRVGSDRYVSVDVRIIAATNRNLRVEVNEGRFRSDLYYRIAVLTVRLPPLRERLDDLPLLVERFLADLGAPATPGTAPLRSAAFLTHLARHSWPGNLRELRNYLEQCLVLHHRPPLAPAPTDPAAVDINQPLKLARQLCIQAFERQYLEALLRRHDGNVRVAAQAAGVDRIYLYRLLWRYGLREAPPRPRRADDRR